MLVAGIIAATGDNGIGIAGVAGGKDGGRGVSLMISTCFGAESSGGFGEAIVSYIKLLVWS